MKTVIVVFGNKRHGKDEVARAIAGELGALHTSFAAPLKAAVELLVGIPADLPDAEKESRLFYGKTARRWWQWFGTEIGRWQVHEDVWVDRLADLVRKTASGVVVVSDGRFRNELGLGERLRGEAHVVNVLVYRPGLPDDRAPTLLWRAIAWAARLVGREVKLMHPSESEVWEMRRQHLAGRSPMFGCVILNDGTLDELRRKARVLGREMGGPPWRRSGD